ncbi:hypothetical protein GCM10009544_09130 [Streptomyces stramineus]|uniref:Uncharacterized protein n=1 Tax=Streptomyces stramineus TaxID=173861 RepID=A0ABN0ZIE2_9ACTN
MLNGPDQILRERTSPAHYEDRSPPLWGPCDMYCPIAAARAARLRGGALSRPDHIPPQQCLFRSFPKNAPVPEFPHEAGAREKSRSALRSRVPSCAAGGVLAQDQVQQARERRVELRPAQPVQPA